MDTMAGVDIAWIIFFIIMFTIEQIIILKTKKNDAYRVRIKFFIFGDSYTTFVKSSIFRFFFFLFIVTTHDSYDAFVSHSPFIISAYALLILRFACSKKK